MHPPPLGGTMFVRVSVKFRDREIKPLMFGPFVTASDDQELLQLNFITERVRRLVERVNRTSGLSESHSIYDRFRLDVEPRQEADPLLPEMRIRQLMVEQYIYQLEEDLFNYEPPLPPIDFEKKPTLWERAKKGFESFGLFLDDMGSEMAKNPSSHVWTGDQY